jgi:hypothetical protein
MKSIAICSVAICMFALLLTACASDDAASARDRVTALWEKHAGAPQDRIVFPRAESWKQLGGSWIALRTQPNDFYLLRLDSVCAEALRFGTGIALTVSQQTRNMLSRSDAVLVDGMNCRIQQIRPVDRDALAAELEAAGLERDFLGTP